MCTCVSMCVCAHACATHTCRYPRRPEEAVGSLEAAVTGRYELTDISAGNRTWVLCKSSRPSQPPSHPYSSKSHFPKEDFLCDGMF